jgi:phosphoglycolate phosphatase-like HAD superfamily hydrolase
MRRYLTVCLAGMVLAAQAAAQPLPSWNEGAARSAILDFIAAAADPASDGFVPEAERIAVFDNDGTLWAEQPIYFQFVFAMDRAAELAAADPAWADTPALEAAAAGDIEAVLAGGDAALLEVVGATHSGMSMEAFVAEAAEWLDEARHPTTGLRYVDMVYQPMLELLDHLRANGFQTWIVSGGGIDFIRAFAEEVYGIPPKQVIGSMSDLAFVVEDGRGEVVKEPGIAFLDDKETKPLAIARHIGRRPVFVGGNSDGDHAMAQWAMAGEGPRMALFVHHTDAAREWAYDRESHIGRLDAALDQATADGWTVVDMARDWARIYPPAGSGQ